MSGLRSVRLNTFWGIHLQIICTTWNYLHTDYDWISYTPVRLYCSPVSVHLYIRTWRILTNESPSKITFMKHVNQSQLIFLGVFTPPHLLRHVGHDPSALQNGPWQKYGTDWWQFWYWDKFIKKSRILVVLYHFSP